MSGAVWPRGGGMTGALVRDFNWAATSLGALQDWPQSLRTTVEIVLDSRVPMVLLWGADHVMIYNDLYAARAGTRHPLALGASIASCWPELWDWNRTVLRRALRGESQSYQDQLLVLERNGVSESAWFDLFYVPIRDEQGRVAGVLSTVQETTSRVLDRQRQQLTEESLLRVNEVLNAERTAVRAANYRLRVETDFLRGLFEQAPSFMAVLRGPDHVFELANAPYLQLVGYRDVIGKPLREALPEVEDQGFFTLLDQVYQTGEPFVGKQMKVVLQPDRASRLENRILDFVYQPIRAVDGSVSGIFVEGIDVTERAATEERLRIAQEAGNIGTFEWFPDTGKLVVSDEYRRIWGFPADVDVTEAMLVGLVDPQHRHLVGPARLNSTENPLEYAEYCITRPDTGERRWIARRGEVIDRGGPAERRYVGVAFDVTERRRIEEALRATEDRLGAIFGQASVGLSELSLDRRYIRVNDALCRMLGRSREEFLHIDIDTIMHPDDVTANRLLFERVIASGEPAVIEKRYRRPDGSYVWVSSNVSRIVDHQGRPQAIIAVKTDISERRRAEEALHELNETLEQRVIEAVAERARVEEALRQSQKMEAVGKLTGGVAHDFNNVLQIISGNLQLMQAEFAGLHAAGASAAYAQKRLDSAIAAVERGAKLSSQLLAFGRRQPLQPIVINLGRLVRNMDDLLRRALGETIELDTALVPDLWNTLVDPGQLENVILNLAINARDAMRGEGKLILRLANAILDERDLLPERDIPGGHFVLLTVSDTGCGMTPDVLEKAFEPFFTTKPEGEGTGLGLSMAYGFVKQSHGTIRIHSEPERGTTVRIYLPRSLQEETERELIIDNGTPKGGSETILVVEDDAGVRATVVDTLSALGYRVRSAENALRALDILQAGEVIDLLFTDVVMPGALRSTELVRQACLLSPGIAVLFTSGYAQDAIVHGGRLDPGVELLSKPYRREDLARKVWHVLAGRRQAALARDALVGGATRTHLPVVPAMPDRPRVLVVEDNTDSLQMVCEMLDTIGYCADGVGTAEAALKLLAQSRFDFLFTDVSLPGISGVNLAKRAVREWPALYVIFASGYGDRLMDHIAFPAQSLQKPYGLDQLQNAMNQANEFRLQRLAATDAEG